MKVYLVIRDDYVEADSYSSFVCYAESGEAAQRMIPGMRKDFRWTTDKCLECKDRDRREDDWTLVNYDYRYEWTYDLDKVIAREIGIAPPDITEAHILHASYRDG